MGYVEGVDVNQVMIMSWDSMVGQDSIARIISVFVDSLDMQELGFQRSEPAEGGRPPYAPASLLKLYLYGARNRIRSSRRLAHACKVNIEVIWLMKAVQPDFRTISDFRKDNIDSMKKVFSEFNRRLAEILEAGFQSVDGSKFRAWNSKDNNFTLSKLDDRIRRMEVQTEEYLRQLADADANGETEDGASLPGQLTREELEGRLADIAQRKEKYEAYLKYMKENGLSQLSLTDPESKLMKTRDGFLVSYNVQTSVDSNTHLIANFEVTDHPADNGLLGRTLGPLREDGHILEAVADKGYQQPEDMAECLENGMIPNVIPPEGRDSYVLEIPYVPCENTGELRGNKDSGSLKKCMEAGVIPDVYADILKEAETVEKTIRVYDFAEDGGNTGEGMDRQAETQLRIRAAEGYFVKDPEGNYVICPAGAKLRRKSIQKNGAVRYCNKLACRNCRYQDKCMRHVSKKYPWKQVAFQEKETEKLCKTWNPECEKEVQQGLGINYHYEQAQVVRMKFYPNRTKMARRMSISEHPFGTLKRTMEGSYFLLKGIREVTGEFALLSLGYNLIRGFNLLGFKKMMEVLGR